MSNNVLGSLVFKIEDASIESCRVLIEGRSFNMQLLYSYVLVTDSGFAPNPFHGYCTLATCKPRIRASAKVNDIVIGTGSAARHVQRGDQLMYAMHITEVLTTAQYWFDPRFECKKPVMSGGINSLGDNVYEPLEHGNWNQLKSLHGADDIERDLSEQTVLVSDKFVYFGSKSPALPRNFVDGRERLIKRGQGHRTESRKEVIAEFGDWIASLGGWIGVVGNPSNSPK